MMFSLPIVLGFACYDSNLGMAKAGLVIAFIGGAVALFHSLFYAGIIRRSVQPCGAGPSCADDKLELFSTLVIPYMSFAAFAAIIVLLGLALRKPAQTFN
jgi:disulfide bond formation protein DsbB